MLGFHLGRTGEICYTGQMNTLHLTQDELSAFQSLPDALREGWQADNESFPISDEPPRKLVRLKLLSLQDPALRRLQEKLSEMDDPDAAALELASLDLSAVSYDDLAELVFAMGPAPLSVLILHLLQSAKTDDDIGDIASLAFLRHELLSATRP